MHAPADIHFLPARTRAPTLRDARPGEVFIVNGDRRVLFALLSHAQVDASADANRRWCVVVSTIEPSQVLGALSVFEAATPVTPVQIVGGLMRVTAAPDAWLGR